ILERAAAAPHDDDFGPARPAEVFEAAADVFDRALALHERRKEADVDAGKAACEDVNQVRDDGASRGCDNADAPRKARQIAFAGAVEQTFGRQLLFELLERELQNAITLRFEKFDEQLILTASLIDVETPAGQDGQAILRLDFPIAMRGAEGHAADLGVALLKREIVMAASGVLEAGNLAGNPEVLKLGIEDSADGRVQLADGEDAPFRGAFKLEGELLHP